MRVCIKCGVELDDGMKVCPLCGSPAAPNRETENYQENSDRSMSVKKSIAPDEKHLLQRIIWQVTAILLLSGIIATLIIDVVIHKQITWSVYPISICLILFSYASVLALWHKRLVQQLLIGWFVSTCILAALHVLLAGNNWTLRLAIPVLFLTNVVCIFLIMTIRSMKTRGLNVFALLTASIAAYCLGLDALISFYRENIFHLQWSIIVAACLLPVTAALFFLFFRTKDNDEFQKIFHT